MYSVVIMLIWVGIVIVFWDKNRIDWFIFLMFIILVILILVWENISNDVFDLEIGIDKNKYYFLVNLIGNKDLMFWLGNLCLFLGILGILIISWWL